MKNYLFLLLAKGQSRRALFDDEARDALGAGATRAAHDDVDITKATAGNERLGAVENVVAALLLCCREERGGVAARARLGKAIRREFFHRRQLGDKLLSQSGRTKRVDHPHAHVVDGEVRRGADTACGQRLKDDRGVDTAQACAAVLVRRVDGAKAEVGE